jgi:hypothetical protein
VRICWLHYLCCPRQSVFSAIRVSSFLYTPIYEKFLQTNLVKPLTSHANAVERCFKICVSDVCMNMKDSDFIVFVYTQNNIFYSGRQSGISCISEKLFLRYDLFMLQNCFHLRSYIRRRNVHSHRCSCQQLNVHSHWSSCQQLNVHSHRCSCQQLNVHSHWSSYQQLNHLPVCILWR